MAQAQPRPTRLNHVIELLEQKKPVFGVYWPTNPSGRGRAGAPPPTDVPPKQPGELAREALAYRATDFLFSGAIEGGIDRGIGPVADFVKATAEAGALSRTPFAGVTAPLIVKAPKIGADTTTGRREHQPRAESRRERPDVRRGRERGRSARGPRGDALQVQRRHAPRRGRRRAGVLGHDASSSTSRRPTSGRSIPMASCSTGRSSKARKGSRTSGRLRP